jgi:23S rRNA pseudouridine1911/1915/1917 synthase
MTPEILYKSKNAIVIYKPPLIPSQSDTSGDKDALTLTSDILKALGEREELYLINRLDRVVGGLMIFARNKKSAKLLSEKLASEEFIKEYFAVIDGQACEGEMIDWIIKDQATNKAIIVNENKAYAKKAILDSQVIDVVEHKQKLKSLVNVELKTGRFHQIRAQFSHRGTPLTGDKKYGSKDFLSRQPSLFAYHILAAIEDEIIDVYRLPDLEKHPWNLFSADKYMKKMRKST